MAEKKEITLKYLFFTFLKIGSISWGGFMALIAVMKRELVDKDEVIGEETVLDGISLASVLPGAVAANVATYIGYQLKGIKGALVCLIGTILPAFLLILVLGKIYTTYGELPVFTRFFMGILPSIAAVILSVAIGMARKQISDYKQIVLCILAGVCLLTIHSFFATLIVITVSAVAGYFFYKVPGTENETITPKSVGISNKRLLFKGIIATFVVLFILFGIRFWGIDQLAWYNINRKIFLTFSGMSLTLFGGGYVIVPAMQAVIVDGFHWLTTKEFADAIAMGQITPGPVIITATFIGFRVAGFLGALVASIAIFTPPGFVMIFFSGFLRRIKDYIVVVAVFKGMRPAIIGMIFSAAYTVGKGAEMIWPSALIFLMVLVLQLRYKMNVVYLIPIAGIAGVFFF